MELDDLIGPLPAPLGRWLLRRLVAGGVRYGRPFSILLIRDAAPEDIVPVLRGADVLALWDGDDLLALLPDTERHGAERAAERVREATGAGVAAAHWSGDIADDLVERAVRSLAAQAAS